MREPRAARGDPKPLRRSLPLPPPPLAYCLPLAQVRASDAQGAAFAVHSLKDSHALVAPTAEGIDAGADLPSAAGCKGVYR